MKGIHWPHGGFDAFSKVDCDMSGNVHSDEGVAKDIGYRYALMPISRRVVSSFVAFCHCCESVVVCFYVKMLILACVLVMSGGSQHHQEAICKSI